MRGSIDDQFKNVMRKLESDPEDEISQQRLISLLCRMGPSGIVHIDDNIRRQLFALQPYLEQPLFDLENRLTITEKKEDREKEHYLYGQYQLTYKSNFLGVNKISIIDTLEKVNTVHHYFKNGKGKATLWLGPSSWRIEAEFATLGLEIKLRKISE